MDEADLSYNAVYHFLDNHLLEVFIEKIPRSELVETLRVNESLRNRYFPGFRISNSVPSSKQIVVAYRKEIVERRNGRLATSLCRSWVVQQPKLADTALRSLDIHSENPANADLWITEVQARLAQEGKDECIRKIVRALASQYSSDDIHIFVSIVSYGLDQQALRVLVDEELRTAAGDSQISKEKIESELAASKTAIAIIEKSHNEIELQLKDELPKLQKELESLTHEHEMLEAQATNNEKRVAELSLQLTNTQTQLQEAEKARDLAKSQKEQLSKLMKRHREDVSRKQSDLERRLSDLSRNHERQSSQIANLQAQLEKINAQQAEEESRKAPLTNVMDGTEASMRGKDAQTAALAPISTATPRKETALLRRNAVCYQGLQRIFRNAVVSFLRERLVRLFPGDHIQRLKKLFGEDWEKGAQNANQSRTNLGTTTQVRDEYDLLGTNHFFGIFDRYYDRIFSPDAGHPAELPKPVKVRFLGNLKAIKDGRDPLSHPVEQEISYEEALHLLYSAGEVLKWLGYEVQANEISALAAELDDEGPETTSLLRRLPTADSIYLEFVGRNALLKEIADLFANPDNKRCLLAGDGGKGKSAVAYRFAQGISASTSRFQLVVWLSAKKRKFRDGAPTTIESPDFTNSAEAIDQLLAEYGATKQDMEKSVSDKKLLLFEYLNQFPAFIIADDIDTVLDDNEVVSLFTHEIPHTQSCVLVTSRRAIPGIRNFIVQGFDSVESEEFIKSRIRLYQLHPSSFTPTIIREIARVTDGSPLYMDDLMRLAKILDINKAIKMWTEKGGDDARKYALQREIEKLTVDAKKVLIAAAVTDDPVSFAELENILEFSEDRLLSALTELQTLFLFPKAPAVEGEQRYQINLNTKKLVRLVEGSSEFYARIDTRTKALAGKLPLVGHGVVGSLIRQALLRLNAEQHAEAEAILLGAIEKYPNAPDLHGVLGYAYRRMRRIADARAQFEAAFKLKSKNPEMYLHWQKLEIAEKEWSRALAVADKALAVCPDAYEIVERKVYTLRQAGFELYRGMHYEKATKMWSDAVEAVKRYIKSPEKLPPGARGLNSSMYYSIVVSLDMLGQFEERNRWLDRWEKEHTDDPQVSAQKEYLIRKRGSLHLSSTTIGVPETL